MVHLHLIGTLDKLNCKGFSAVGEVFDPERHEAVEQQTTDEVPAGCVVREYQKGYLLAERLLRPAMVVVATPASPVAPAPADAEPEDVVVMADTETGEPANIVSATADIAADAQSIGAEEDDTLAPATEPDATAEAGEGADSSDGDDPSSA